MDEPINVQPIGYGTVPEGINCYPVYGHGSSAEGGDSSWSGIILQFEDGVQWFLTVPYAQRLWGRLLVAIQAAAFNEGNLDNLVGWDEPDQAPPEF